MVCTAFLSFGSAAAWELTVEAPTALSATARRVQGLDTGRLADVLAAAGLEPPLAVVCRLLPNDDPRAAAVPPWIVGQAYENGEIVIFPERVVAYPYDSLESVVRHEVVHLALFEGSGGRSLPRWFHEGVAVLLEGGFGVVDSAQLMLAAARGPAVTDLARLFESETRPETAQAYRLAAALVRDLQRRHGTAVIGAIVAHVARGIPFGRAFELETGEAPDVAAARTWAAYRRWTAWLPAVTSGAALWTLILALAFVAFVARQARRRWKDDAE